MDLGFFDLLVIRRYLPLSDFPPSISAENTSGKMLCQANFAVQGFTFSEIKVNVSAKSARFSSVFSRDLAIRWHFLRRMVFANPPNKGTGVPLRVSKISPLSGEDRARLASQKEEDWAARVVLRSLPLTVAINLRPFSKAS